MGLQRAADGCYHPVNEEELCELVRDASEQGRQLRVLGSTHSVWKAIVTDSFAGPNTPDREMPVVLDRYTRIFEPQPDPSDPTGQRKLVTAQAGCHVGLSPDRPVQARIVERPAESDVRQPSPWHQGTWDASLTSTLHHRYGLALPDLGGISHQTIAGFISTGSAGGTVKWSVHDAIVELRVIDGTGAVKTVSPQSDPDWFAAAAIGLGLCGVISTITFRCVPTFDLVGSETISKAGESPVLDFYGTCQGTVPSLERFLLDTDYARLMWWPQKDFDRLVVWQAARAPFEPDRELQPYKEIAHFSVASQGLASVIYTLLGQLDEPKRALEQLREVRKSAVVIDFEGLLSRTGGRDPSLPPPPTEAHHVLPWLSAMWKAVQQPHYSPVTMGAAWVVLVELLVTLSDELLEVLMHLPLLRELFAFLGKQVPDHLHTLLSVFVSLGKDDAPTVQHFSDRGFMGLPMDNQMDDLLMPTWFTELWVPFTPGDGKVQATIDTLHRHFNSGTAAERYAKTGAFSFELYAGKREDRFWLSPAWGSHVFRVDVFWFGKNAGNPVTGFYRQFWDVLAPLGYRLHWGKFLPEPGTGFDLTRGYPEWSRWAATRRRVDPRDVFVTDYWKRHLGL